MLFGFRLEIDKVFLFDGLIIRKAVLYVNEIVPNDVGRSVNDHLKGMFIMR